MHAIRKAGLRDLTMLDAIAGLSALAAGMVTPVSLRRTYALAEARSAAANVPAAEDRLELSPGHIHEDGQTCPICGAEIGTGDGPASVADEAPEQAGAGSQRGLVAGLRLELAPEEKEKLRKLKDRDQEVRTHEQAHKATGGQFAGAASYSYQTGPDGRQYAVGGEVSVDLSPVPGDPQATIAKMQQIRRAALAPAQPSSQDMQVAAQASRIETEAQAELAGKKPNDPGGTSKTGQFQIAPPRGGESSKPRSPFTPQAAGEANPIGILVDVAI